MSDVVYLGVEDRSEWVAMWRLRRLILTIRALRVARVDPNSGRMLALEADLIKRWVHGPHG